MPESQPWNWVQSKPDRLASIEAMLAVLEAALARNGDNELLQLRVLEGRVAAGKMAAAVALGNGRPPGKPGVGFNSHDWDRTVANALFKQRRYEEFLARVGAASEFGDEPELRRMRIAALLRTDRIGEAAAELDLQRSDPDAMLKGSVLNLAMSHWGHEAVLSHLDRRATATSEPASDADARLICLLNLERSREASAMVDPRCHITEFQMTPPTLWQQSQFLEALIAEIRELGGLEYEPVGKSTVGGRQSLSHFPGQSRALAALTEQFKCEVERYCASLPPDDPIRNSRPERPQIFQWVVLLDQDGHQEPHIHPGAWLSGVYYVATPDTDLAAGALRIGLPPASGETMPWPVRLVIPEPGKLVLFPSFLRHDTLPHRGTQLRICISFDIYHANPEQT